MDTSLYPRLGALALAAVVVIAFGLWRRHIDGRARGVRAEVAVTSADIGTALGERLTLLQFSSPACGPCVVTRRRLSDAAREASGVVHVDLDVTEHVELVRRLQILRTPTTMYLDGDGRVTARVTGVPTAAELATATAASREVLA